MTGESRLADLQGVYQLTHAKFPAPESSNNADACRIYDSLPKGGKVAHLSSIYIGIYRYIKRDVRGSLVRRRRNTRRLVHGSYLILYRTSESDRLIEILRFCHRAR